MSAYLFSSAYSLRDILRISGNTRIDKRLIYDNAAAADSAWLTISALILRRDAEEFLDYLRRSSRVVRLGLHEGARLSHDGLIAFERSRPLRRRRRP